MARVMSSSVVEENRVSLVCVDGKPTLTCYLNLCLGSQPVALGRPREEGLDSHFSDLLRPSDNARLASVSFIMCVRSLVIVKGGAFFFKSQGISETATRFCASTFGPVSSAALARPLFLFDVGISLAPLFCAVSFVTCTTRPPSSPRFAPAATQRSCRAYYTLDERAAVGEE